MTTIELETRVCGACGATSEVRVLMSSSTLGAADTDLRPAPMLRHSLELAVQCCPSCGFCATDLAEKNEAKVGAMNHPAYKAILRDEKLPLLVRRFVCASRLEKAAGDHAAAGWEMVHAAWVLDDEEDDVRATEYRLQAIAAFRAARDNQQKFAKDGLEPALLADLLRRAGRFEDARTMAERGLDDPGIDGNVRALLELQVRLSAATDAGVHTLDEIEEEAATDAGVAPFAPVEDDAVTDPNIALERMSTDPTGRAPGG